MKTLGEDGLKREPITFGEDVWGYEETYGLSLYDHGTRIGKIHIRTIRAYLKRIDAKKKAKRGK